MTKLTLVAAPTFTAKVPIPISGGEPVEVQMTFKHRTRKALEEFVSKVTTRAEAVDADIFMSMVSAWDLEDEFTKENVDILLENRIGTFVATYRVYLDQLMQAKLGN